MGTLSGGQKRRADVAIGIVGDPDLIFLDEPTTGFDPGLELENVLILLLWALAGARIASRRFRWEPQAGTADSHESVNSLCELSDIHLRVLFRH